MGKFNKKRHKRVPIMYQASVQTLIRGLLKQPFDVSMAALIVLVDVDPTISQMKDVQDFVSGLTEMEQQFAVMLEAALQANKVKYSRMQEAVTAYNLETGSKLRIGQAAADEGFAAWLPGYNVLFKAKWREENPEEAAAYDAQQAAQVGVLNNPENQTVAVLQATGAQGDVTPLLPEGVAFNDADMPDAQPDAP